MRIFPKRSDDPHPANFQPVLTVAPESSAESGRAQPEPNDGSGRLIDAVPAPFVGGFQNFREIYNLI